jgi:hypothetical protein
VVRYRLSGAKYRTTQGNTAPLNRRSAGEANTAKDGADIGNTVPFWRYYRTLPFADDRPR